MDPHDHCGSSALYINSIRFYEGNRCILSYENLEWVFIMLAAAVFLYASVRSSRKLEAET